MKNGSLNPEAREASGAVDAPCVHVRRQATIVEVGMETRLDVLSYLLWDATCGLKSVHRSPNNPVFHLKTPKSRGVVYTLGSVYSSTAKSRESGRISKYGHNEIRPLRYLGRRNFVPLSDELARSGSKVLVSYCVLSHKMKHESTMVTPKSAEVWGPSHMGIW